MLLTLSCKLVEVFAMICAVLLHDIKPNIPLCFSIKSRIFSRPHQISSLRRPFATADYLLLYRHHAHPVDGFQPPWPLYPMRK